MLPSLRATSRFAIVLFTLSLLLLAEPTRAEDYEATGVGLQLEARNTSHDFGWLDVKPTPDLVWHPCYQPLRRECARLLVPLNHLNDSADGSAAIALIRIPANVSTSSPQYRGPILLNPGGPGGSGVDFINQAGDMLTEILGNEFDLVSFDPRGIHRSTPKILFFDPPGRGEREAWDGLDAFGVIRSGAGDLLRNVTGENGISLEFTWARAVASNRQAEERGGEWLGNMNTEQTAYDMLSIINAYGREKLMYWGISYGTVLGATFASLFPDKVERMILDGVVDADNYYATLWSNNLLDTSKTMNLFYETCHTAGSSLCPFWAPSPELIAANLTRIYEDLIASPIPVHTNTSYGFLDYSRVRSMVFLSLYAPWATWPSLAQALADLGGPQRNPELMWTLITAGAPTFRCACSGSCDDKDTLKKELAAAALEARTAISCADGMDIPSDVASAKSYFNDLTQESEWADIWAIIHVSCAGWPKLKKGYQGPVGANTSSPLLFIGNTADPVTPLVNAKAMSTRFPGSRVLTQDSPGHASVNGPSSCTISHLKEYFLSGTLPPEGTVCPVDLPPFNNASVAILGAPTGNITSGSDSGINIFARDDENADAGVKRTRDVLHELSKAWKPFNKAFLPGR